MSDECKYYYYDNGYSCSLRREKENDSHVDSDDVKRFCWGYNYNDCPVYKKYDSADTGCFLTSACVEAMGLADDCYELTVLRFFRDNYMALLPCGKEEVQEYYRYAPPIVTKIKNLPNAKEVFAQIYMELIVPCVSLIEAGKNYEAYIKYKNYTNLLRVQYCT